MFSFGKSMKSEKKGYGTKKNVPTFTQLIKYLYKYQLKAKIYCQTFGLFL